ncbi:MAG TPA: hypothetical protein VGO93_08480 [Candidatus Xenobia bacterium]|jgi:hypothetical protein
MIENDSQTRVQFLGFLSWQKQTIGTDLKVRAAALVVDRRGHPVEFRYTDTVCVNQIQQTLYGSQFVTGFLGKVLFEPLVAAVSTDVSVWMVAETDLRSLRPALQKPLLEVAPGSIGDWPKFCTHTLFPQDLDLVSELYDTAGQWSCMEVFTRVEAVLIDLPEESIVTVVPPKAARAVEEEIPMVLPPLPLPWPETPGEDTVEIEEARLDSSDEQPAEVSPEYDPEPVRAADEKPDSMSDSDIRPGESVESQLERLLMHLVEAGQLQPTHYGYQVAGNLMWVHRAHFFNVAEAVQSELPLTVEIDRELLRKSAQKGVIEAYEVYKELYGKMAVVFKIDLRKYPRLSELVAVQARTAGVSREVHQEAVARSSS